MNVLSMLARTKEELMNEKNSLEFSEIVMKIEFCADDFPVTTGTFNPREDSKSVPKVFAKLRRVGGIKVSPSVLTAF